MTSYREMAEKLKNKEAFTGNSVSAFNDNGIYTVYSYSTIILKMGELVEPQFNNKYYSKTTSKIQNMLIRVFGLNNGKTERS